MWLILLINFYFLFFWLLRLITVFFRLHLQRLRQLSICMWLNYIDINDYESDLVEAIVIHNSTLLDANRLDVSPVVFTRAIVGDQSLETPFAQRHMKLLKEKTEKPHTPKPLNVSVIDILTPSRRN